MTSFASETVPENKLEHDDRQEDVLEAEVRTSGGKKESKWEVVTKTAGLTTAEIIVGRLMAEGIPALPWQEGAGQAFGLTVGLLGTGYVLVPEQYLEQARDILETSLELDEMDTGESDAETTSGEV